MSVESLTQAIASNSILQAISIFVAVMTAVIFLLKNIPPAIKFGFDYTTKGRKRAYLNLNRSIARLAIRDSRHPSLIPVSLSILKFKALGTYFILIILGIALIFFYLFLDITIKDPEFQTMKWYEIGLTSIISTSIAIVTGFALFRPIERYYAYIYWIRRLTVKIPLGEEGSRDETLA